MLVAMRRTGYHKNLSVFDFGQSAARSCKTRSCKTVIDYLIGKDAFLQLVSRRATLVGKAKRCHYGRHLGTPTELFLFVQKERLN
jgi:hypothetical protein